jgi:hypothetical protein
MYLNTTIESTAEATIEKAAESSVTWLEDFKLQFGDN